MRNIAGLGYRGFRMLSDTGTDNARMGDDTEMSVAEGAMIDETVYEATPTLTSDSSNAVIEEELESIDIPTGDSDAADLEQEVVGL